MFQIIIPKRAAVCAAGGEPMVPGMEYYSALMPSSEEGRYERKDFCAACWQRMESRESTNGVWRSVVPQKKAVSDLPKRREDRALYLLKEALRTTEHSAKEEAFVLALLLARGRRIFQRQEIKRADQTFVLYEVAETEEMLCVPKVELSQLKIDQLQADLAKKFHA